MKLKAHNKLTVLSGGTFYSISYSDPRYEEAEIILDRSEDEFIEFVSKSYVAHKLAGRAGFQELDGKIYYNTIQIKGALETKVKSLIEKGNDLHCFDLFMDNVLLNPDPRAQEELFDFLAYRELPLTDRGTFLAYKGVLDNYYSSYGNKDTRVIHGTVDEQGRIYNGVGEYIEVEREDVDPNRSVECGTGIHAGSLVYAKGHAQRVIIIEINPKDAVSVPKGYSFQKLRCCAYTVVADFVEEITAPLTTPTGEVIQGVATNTRAIDECEGFIRKLLGYKTAIGEEEIHLLNILDELKESGSGEFEYKELERILKIMSFSFDEDGYVALNK